MAFKLKSKILLLMHGLCFAAGCVLCAAEGGSERSLDKTIAGESAAPRSASKETAVGAQEKAGAFTISFYGKVVDWHGAHVPHATVIYSVADGTAPVPGRPTRYTLTADAAGRFFIDSTGPYLYVSVKKEGYQYVREVPVQATFGDVVPSVKICGTTAIFSSDNDIVRNRQGDKPVLFMLKEVERLEPLVTQDSKLLFDSVSSVRVMSFQDSNRSRLMTVSGRRESIQSKDDPSLHQWRFTFSVKGGGIMAQNDDGFEAPEKGYLPEVTVISDAKQYPLWKGLLARWDFYVRFSDGVYGRVAVYGNLVTDGKVQQPFLKFTSYFNPNPKSRNLEAEIRDVKSGR